MTMVCGDLLAYDVGKFRLISYPVSDRYLKWTQSCSVYQAKQWTLINQ